MSSKIPPNNSSGVTLSETEDERRSRLRRPVGAADVLIVKEKCPDIPHEFLMKLMFGQNTNFNI